jgi:hypothetical protein
MGLAPQRPETLDLELVDHPRAEEDPPGLDGGRWQPDLECPALAPDLLDPDVAGFDVGVGLELLATDAPELTRRHSVAGHEVVDLLGRGVARRPRIAEQDALARDRGPEQQRGRRDRLPR